MLSFTKGGFGGLGKGWVPLFVAVSIDGECYTLENLFHKVGHSCMARKVRSKKVKK